MTHPPSPQGDVVSSHLASHSLASPSSQSGYLAPGFRSGAGFRARAPSLTRGLIAPALGGTVLTAAVAGVAVAWGSSPTGTAAAALVAGTILTLVAMGIATRRLRQSLTALADGIRNFRTGDFSVRLAARRADEVDELLALYNELADALRNEHGNLYQRELLLDTLLQTAPVATVLVSGADRIVFSNRAARQLLGRGRRLEGRRFANVLTECSAAMQEALASSADSLFTVTDGAVDETFRATRTHFQLNVRAHTLYTIERLTPELRRHEVQTWKNAIRVINHELANSLAPIRSLAHTGRHVLDHPEHGHRLREVFSAIEERVTHLTAFLDGYGQLAKVPKPCKEPVHWETFIAHLSGIATFRARGHLPSTEGCFDPGLLEQALINLLKNAHESGSAASDVELEVQETFDGGCLIRVFDRGPGMADDELRQALLPFYTSKAMGTGVGLSLSHEVLEAHGGSLQLENRKGGGVVATCRLPGTPRRE